MIGRYESLGGGGARLARRRLSLATDSASSLSVASVDDGNNFEYSFFGFLPKLLLMICTDLPVYSCMRNQ